MVVGGSAIASVVVVVGSVVLVVEIVVVVGTSLSSVDVIWIADVVAMLFLLGPGRVFVGLRFTGLLVIVSDELKEDGAVVVSPDWFIISVPGSWSVKIRYRYTF